MVDGWWVVDKKDPVKYYVEQSLHSSLNQSNHHKLQWGIDKRHVKTDIKLIVSISVSTKLQSAHLLHVVGGYYPVKRCWSSQIRKSIVFASRKAGEKENRKSHPPSPRQINRIHKNLTPSADHPPYALSAAAGIGRFGF